MRLLFCGSVSTQNPTRCRHRTETDRTLMTPLYLTCLPIAQMISVSVSVSVSLSRSFCLSFSLSPIFFILSTPLFPSLPPSISLRLDTIISVTLIHRNAKLYTQRMGLQHVLENYLRGLRVGPASLRGLPDLDGDLRDMQFESAWRMSEWDPALSVGVV